MITAQSLAQQFVNEHGSSDDAMLPINVTTWLTGLILDALRGGETHYAMELQAARSRSSEVVQAIRALQPREPMPRADIAGTRGLPTDKPPTLPTTEQIAAMSLEEYAKARRVLGVPEPQSYMNERIR